MPDIFDINFETQVRNILPPTKRLPKMLAYMFSIVFPLQWLRDLWLDSYKKGSTAPFFVNATFYVRGDRVIWTDKSVYEFKKLIGVSTIGINAPTGDPGSAVTWMKVQDLFIGVDERIRYNSQIMVLEYALNHYYLVPVTDPQIFINNNPDTNTTFLMGNTGIYGSYMPKNAIFATRFMPNVAAFTPFVGNFTVNVPAALFATLGATTQDQENNIRNFVDKYKLAGKTYNVVTF